VRPKKAPSKTHEEFVFHVRAPSLSYHFRIEHDRKRIEWRPFDESETVHFIAECIWPDRFTGREAKAALRPEPALVDHKLLDDDDVLRKSIGFLRTSTNEFEADIWLPPRVCWRLGDAMASGLVSSMLTNGLTESKGMNRLTSVSFHGQGFDPVAYVG
jgi:hypothetical protein